MRLGVVGAGGLAERMGQHLGVVAIAPRDAAEDVAREVDALLLELSAFEDPTGPWAHALRPGGFDRGRALASLLRAAAAAQRPVLAVDDLPEGAADEWQRLLAANLDDVVRLGPLGEVSWNPGTHVAAEAMGVADEAPGVAIADPAPAPSWAERQHAAVLRGEATLDPQRPWDVHAAAELALLGVETTGPGARAVPTAPPVDVRVATAALCRRLDLPCPVSTPTRVVLDRPAGDAATSELDAAIGDWEVVTPADLAALPTATGAAGDEVVLVAAPGPPVDAPGLRAAGVALASLAGAAAVAARGDTAFAVRRGALPPGVADADSLHALVRALAPPRRVVP